MSARSGYFGVWTLCSLAVLSATAAMAGPGVRHCTPITAQVTPDTTNGRTPISSVPWVSGTGGEKVVYGTDDRIDVYQETDAARKALAGSVCALMTSSQLTQTGSGWHISTSAYRENGLPACASEPFGSQPTAAFCTGFLVGSNIVATAGHCYDSSDISGVRFVFGFEMTDADTVEVDVAADQVYTGTALLGHRLDSPANQDYSIIQLDRAVTAPGAVPLDIRRSGVVPDSTAVGVIGYPAGLPKKIAFGATTRVSDNTAAGYFVANLDTYGGNSGSPVFNAATGVVEGILVRGNDDFTTNGSCFVSATLSDNWADAEQVSKATTFQQYVPETAGKGVLRLNASAYSCAGTVEITLTDTNAADTAQQVTVTSDAGDTETVTLAETASGSHAYTGSIVLQAGAVTAGDGTLSITDGTGITVLYADADNGHGRRKISPRTPRWTARLRRSATSPLKTSPDFRPQSSLKPMNWPRPRSPFRRQTAMTRAPFLFRQPRVPHTPPC